MICSEESQILCRVTATTNGPGTDALNISWALLTMHLALLLLVNTIAEELLYAAEP